MPRVRLTSSALALLLAAAACRAPAPRGAAPAPRPPRAEADAFARSAVAAERALASDSLPVRSVGVLPLRVDAADTALAALGYGLADLLTTDLAQSARLEVVDRLRVEALLRELEFGQGGRVDPATAPRLGRLVRARRLVLGGVQALPGGEVAVSTTLTDVGTGGAGAALNARTRLDHIFRAEKELAFRLFRDLGVTLTPRERRAVEQRATQNLAALVAYGRGVRYEVEARFDAAAPEYEAALRHDPNFALARARLAGLRPNHRLVLAAGRERYAAVGGRAAGSVAGRLNPAGFRSVPSGALVDPAQQGDRYTPVGVGVGVP
jgi:TolB-like protein